jgi:hypothetical protein
LWLSSLTEITLVKGCECFDRPQLLAAYPSV